MKRIIIVGNGGSGKSVLARRLGTLLDLEVIHLDRYFWRSGWQPTPRDEWRETVGRLVREETWVMDGSYAGTVDLRFPAADTIVFLDLPRWRCLWQAITRLIRYSGQSRPDLAPGCPEGFDWTFLKWIWHYHRDDRPIVLQNLTKYADGRTVVVLRSPREMQSWLRRVALGRGEVTPVKSR